MVVSQKELIKVAIKNDGHTYNTAKELGISHQAVHQRINKNPNLKKAVLNAREQALKAAGLSRSKVYKSLAEGLKAKVVVIHEGKASETKIPDHNVRHKYGNTVLQLYRDLKDEDNQTPISSIGALVFNIVTSSKREVIEIA